MQTVTIICVGKLKDKFFFDASKEYEKRLQAFCKCEIVEVPAENLPDNPSDGEINACLEKEADKILKKINTQSTVISMCIEGKMYSSEALSELMRKTQTTGNGNMTFVIGGSYGLSDRVKSISDVKMSMSPMTFPHRLARIMLLEQIYRGYMIENGRKYHK